MVQAEITDMRENLKKLHGVRTRFQGTFVRFGEKSSFKGPPKVTVLLKDVKRGSDILCDHLWFNLTKELEKLDLQPNDVVEFDARVTGYVKGYKGHRRSDDEFDDDAPLEKDYRLSHPTKVLLKCEPKVGRWF